MKHAQMKCIFCKAGWWSCWALTSQHKQKNKQLLRTRRDAGRWTESAGSWLRRRSWTARELRIGDHLRMGRKAEKGIRLLKELEKRNLSTFLKNSDSASWCSKNWGNTRIEGQLKKRKEGYDRRCIRYLYLSAQIAEHVFGVCHCETFCTWLGVLKGLLSSHDSILTRCKRWF